MAILPSKLTSLSIEIDKMPLILGLLGMGFPKVFRLKIGRTSCGIISPLSLFVLQLKTVIEISIKAN